MVLSRVGGELFAWCAASLVLSRQRLQQNWQSSARMINGEPATHKSSFGESREVAAFHTTGQDCSNKHATGCCQSTAFDALWFRGLAGAERDDVAVVLMYSLV